MYSKTAGSVNARN